LGWEDETSGSDDVGFVVGFGQAAAGEKNGLTAIAAGLHVAAACDKRRSFLVPR
jgi:hypothetical protein